MAHSPAPWTARVSGISTGSIYDANGDHVVYELAAANEFDDAALICAAPELLDASHELLRHLQRLSITHPHLVDDAMCLRARTAIAKATNPIEPSIKIIDEFHCGKCGRLLGGESHNCTNPIETT